MKVLDTNLLGVKVIEPKVFGDIVVGLWKRIAIRQ